MSVQATTGSQREVLRLPTATVPDTSWYWGAKVFDGLPGVHKNVVYFDLWSLYPNSMRSLNASLETIVGTQDKLEESEWTEDDCLWGYVDTRDVEIVPHGEPWDHLRDPETTKCIRQYKADGDLKKRWTAPEPRFERFYYLKPEIRKGEMTHTVDKWMGLKGEYKGDDQYDAVKAVVNSTYGVVGYASQNDAFRVYHNGMAETITLCGRKIITWTSKRLLEYGNEMFDEEVVLTHGDTDGVGISLPDHLSQEEVLEYAEKLAEKVNAGYGEYLKEEFGMEKWWMEAEIDWLADRIFIPRDAKKRYVLHKTWDSKPVDSIKIKGYEAIRSDVADVTSETQMEVLTSLVTQTTDESKESTEQLIQSVCERIREGEYPIEKMGMRKGIGQPLEEYGGPNKRSNPIIRGSKYANQNLGAEITDGSKPLKYPVERIVDPTLPRTYTADTAEHNDELDWIAVENPRVLKGKIEIDYEKIIEKYVEDKIRPITDVMGWDWYEIMTGVSQTDISNYF